MDADIFEDVGAQFISDDRRGMAAHANFSANRDTVEGCRMLLSRVC